MDDATFIIVIHNAPPPLGGTTMLTTILYGQDHMIVDHVTNFWAIDVVVDIVLEDVLGEGGSYRYVSQKGLHQPPPGNMTTN